MVWAERIERARRWGRTLTEFALVQGLVQLLLALAGLLIVRTMSKHDYAFYAIANSMQVTGNLLADLGIGIGVRSIGGRVWADRERFGQLVATALSLRRRFALISLSVTLPFAAWLLWRNGASWGLTAGLCLTIVAGVIPLLQFTVFNASLQLHAEYRRIQKLSLGSAVLRCALIVGLVITRINALLAALVGVISNWFELIFARRWAREKANPLAQTNAEDRRELMKLSWRWMPNLVFFCFQGQITLLILAFMGMSGGIADITALGRIATLFTIFTVTFSNVLAPRFARCQDPARLPWLYLLLVSGTILVLLPALIFSWFLPGPLLWLLGGKYAGLGHECSLVVLAACISQVGSVMTNLNLSKAWIRIQSVAAIPTVLSAQVLAAFGLNLRQFHDVLIFNIINAAAPILIFLIDAYLGIKKESRSQTACKSVYL